MEIRNAPPADDSIPSGAMERMEKGWVKTEAMRLGGAFTYFTRIPLPGSWIAATGSMNASLRYLPLVGWIVGGAGALVYRGGYALFPASLAILFSMVATLFLTGGLHEDGFADFLDGMGGGQTKEEVLRIMKDPHTGAFGSMGLVMVLAIKFFAILSLPAKTVSILLVVAHTVSRFFTGALPSFLPYARQETIHPPSRTSRTRRAGSSQTVPPPSGKALPFVAHGVAYRSIPALFLSGLWVIPPLLLLDVRLSLAILLPLPLITWLMARYFRKRIGGYTGDCLGAMQQVAEVAVYLTALIVLRRFPLWSSI